jgi:hypothetical protein
MLHFEIDLVGLIHEAHQKHSSQITKDASPILVNLSAKVCILGSHGVNEGNWDFDWIV